MGREQQVGPQVDDRHQHHDQEAVADLPLGCDLAGQPSAEPCSGHDAGDGQDKKPEKLPWLQGQQITQKSRCCQHVQKHAVERHPAGQRQQQEAWT